MPQDGTEDVGLSWVTGGSGHKISRTGVECM